MAAQTKPLAEHLRQWWARMGDEVLERLTPAVDRQVKPPVDDFRRAVEHARREWHTARAYFDQVTEPELIEQAVHRLKAAERHYVYLLRKAREEGLA